MLVKISGRVVESQEVERRDGGTGLRIDVYQPGGKEVLPVFGPADLLDAVTDSGTVEDLLIDLRQGRRGIYGVVGS